jgi:hypothetical protein
MTMAEYSAGAFALLNAARTVAYLPQIARIYRDPNGAMAVSIITWLLFTSANVATVAYAVFASGDLLVAAVFCLNGVGCCAITLMTLTKRFNGFRREPQAKAVTQRR